jgi:hypothetical protein
VGISTAPNTRVYILNLYFFVVGYICTTLPAERWCVEIREAPRYTTDPFRKGHDAQSIGFISIKRIPFFDSSRLALVFILPFPRLWDHFLFSSSVETALWLHPLQNYEMGIPLPDETKGAYTEPSRKQPRQQQQSYIPTHTPPPPPIRRAD